MREKSRRISNARRRRCRSTLRAPSPSGAAAHSGSLERFPSPPFSDTAGESERAEPPPSSTGSIRTSELRDTDRPLPKPPSALPTSICESETQTQPNPALQLTNTDAAQSVAGAPLCLLSVFAAERHVGQAESHSDEEHSS